MFNSKWTLQGWYIKCHSPNYPKKKLSLWIFFLLMELELSLQLCITILWSNITLKIKKSSKKKSLKFYKIWNENENLKNPFQYFNWFFSRPIFLEFFKIIKSWWYEFGNGNKCELQHHLNGFFEKSLYLDSKNGP